MSTIVNIIKVYEGYVEVSGNARVKFVRIDQISLNNSPIMYNDIKVNDSIKITFDGNYNILAAGLIKQSQKPPQPPQPLKSRNSVIKIISPKLNPQKVLPPQIISPGCVSSTQSGGITDLTSLNNLDLTTENSKAITSIFELYRKICSGPINMGLAILVSIIDYSITYRTNEIITKMHSLLRDFYHERIPESQSDLQILDYILTLINSKQLVKAKLRDLQKYYCDYQNDFNLLIRNCLQILVKIKYFTEEYDDRRDFNPRPELLSRIINSLGSPQIEDFTFFLNYFDISLRIVDGGGLNIFSLGGARHPIYLLQKNDGYYPLYTIEDAYLQKASEQDYDSTMSYLIENKKNEFREFEIEMNDKNQELEKIMKQNNELAKVYLKINGSINPTRDIKIAAQNTGGAFTNAEIREILHEKCCNQCNALVELVRFDCNHAFCQNCVYSTETPEYRACFVCGFYTDFAKICQRYQEAGQV